MIFYTSDLHFGHRNVIEFDKRPFESVQEMEEVLIQKWNDKVKAEDEVYILGDFVYRSDKDSSYFLKKLNGKKHLIVGNHDRTMLKNNKAMRMFESVSTLKTIRDGNHYVILCHYPLCEWEMDHYGSIHLYGHIHNNQQDTYDFMKNRKNAYNVGCMLHDYAPVSLEELLSL